MNKIAVLITKTTPAAIPIICNDKNHDYKNHSGSSQGKFNHSMSKKKLLTVGNFDSPVKELQFSIEITDTTIRAPAAKKLMTIS